MCFFVVSQLQLILAHLSRKLRGELIEKQSSPRPTVRPCMRPSSVNTFKHQYLSDQRVDCNQILPEALLGRGKCCIRIWQDRTRTLVSMATDNFHRVIMGKTVLPLFSAVFHPIFFILQVTMTYARAWRSLKFDAIRPLTAELAAPPLSVGKIPRG